jgi:hypothetical protein
MPASPSRDKVRRHRQVLRAQGLRPIQIWVPDTRSPAFRAEAERQARLADAGPEFDDVMDFLERVSVFDESDEDDAPR